MSRDARDAPLGLERCSTAPGGGLASFCWGVRRERMSHRPGQRRRNGARRVRNVAGAVRCSRIGDDGCGEAALRARTFEEQAGP